MVSYPKWLYHSTKEPVVVASEEEQKALGPGWCESPADCKSPPPRGEPETLGELAEELGVKAGLSVKPKKVK
jgi:hypothetical protein